MIDFSDSLKDALTSKPDADVEERRPGKQMRRGRRFNPLRLSGQMVEVTFAIHAEHAPAFRSTVEEWSNEIGGRVEGPHSFAKEDALTDALVSMGKLRAAVNRVIPTTDPDY